MARRKANPFADKLRRLPYRASIKRDGPFRRGDDAEIEAACVRIAAGAEFISYAGSRGEESGCKVLGFDTPEKAREMQAWIDESGIATRPMLRLSEAGATLQWEATKEAE
jgi:hypothetical protein